MPVKKFQLSPEECQKFWKNTRRMPSTGRKVMKDGPIYKQIIKGCNFSPKKPCDIFKKFEHKYHPVSGRKLSAASLNKWKRECSPSKTDEIVRKIKAGIKKYRAAVGGKSPSKAKRSASKKRVAKKLSLIHI